MDVYGCTPGEATPHLGLCARAAGWICAWHCYTPTSLPASQRRLNVLKHTGLLSLNPTGFWEGLRPNFAFPMTEAQVSNSHRSILIDQGGKVCLKQCPVAVQSGLLLQLLLTQIKQH